MITITAEWFSNLCDSSVYIVFLETRAMGLSLQNCSCCCSAGVFFFYTHFIARCRGHLYTRKRVRIVASIVPQKLLFSRGPVAWSADRKLGDVFPLGIRSSRNESVPSPVSAPEIFPPRIALDNRLRDYASSTLLPRLSPNHSGSATLVLDLRGPSRSPASPAAPAPSRVVLNRVPQPSLFRSSSPFLFFPQRSFPRSRFYRFRLFSARHMRRPGPPRSDDGHILSRRYTDTPSRV